MSRASMTYACRPFFLEIGQHHCRISSIGRCSVAGWVTPKRVGGRVLVLRASAEDEAPMTDASSDHAQVQVQCL